MKRLREIDLEAPVREDDEGEDEGSGDSYASIWDGRSFTKKSRWMNANQPGNVGRASPVWQRDMEVPYQMDVGENYHNLETKEVRVESRGAGGANSRPFAGLELQLGTPFDSADSKVQVEGSLEQIEVTNDGTRLELNSPIRDGTEKVAVGEGGADNEEKMDTADRIDFIHAKDDTEVIVKPLIFDHPPARLLFSKNEHQDDNLHVCLEKLAAAMNDTDVSTRLKGISFISERLQLVKNSATRRFLLDSIQQRIWNEEELAVSLSLVKLLCSVAVMSGVDNKEQSREGRIQEGSSRGVALDLLQYVAAKDVHSCPMKSALKLQILRSLYLIGKVEDITVLDSLRDLARDQLGQSNPRLREWGIRLLVEGIKERSAVESEKGALSGNIRKSWAHGESLMHTLLEFTRDPHPSVREAVVLGLTKMHRKGFVLHTGTYKRAVTLLRDSSECVRLCAITLVGFCAKTASQDLLDEAQAKVVDNAFLQICNMMTDMSTSVRQEACNTLAKMTGVSENLLLQSLTKKVSAVTGPNKELVAVAPFSSPDGVSDTGWMDDSKLLGWSAGAFVVALEDEFWEVRLAAIRALAKLGINSEKMASNALELVVDMINDDTSHVRQQTMYALTKLALAGRLSVIQAHLHMFLGVLQDRSLEIRKAGYDLLSCILLPSIGMFQLTVRALLTSLEKNPEDEENLLCTLEKLGKSHASHTECITAELLQELRVLINGESGLDEPQCAAIIVLLLAAATSNAKIISLIPSHILSLTSLYGHKLPKSLPSLKVLPMGFRTMQYTWFRKESFLKEPVRNDLMKESDIRFWNADQKCPIAEPVENLEENMGENLDTDSSNFRKGVQPTCELEGDYKNLQRSLLVAKRQQKSMPHLSGEEEVLKSTMGILASASSTNILLEPRAHKEILLRLSGCRKELKALKGRCLGLSGAVTFSGLYLLCLVPVFQLRSHFLLPEGSWAAGVRSGVPHELLNKLELVVKHLLYRFSGFNYDQLLQVYELYALVYVWKLALNHVDHLINDVATSVPFQQLKSVSVIVAKILEDKSLSQSIFLNAVQEQLLREESKISNVWKTARDIALFYRPSRMSVIASTKEIWADLKVPGIDFEHRLGFVAGLPLGISVDVTLHNVPEIYSVWIQYAVDSAAAQYKLLEIAECGRSSAGYVQKVSAMLQIDEMPSIASCVCKICVVVEGVDDQGSSVETSRGPKGSLVPLCVEKQAHLVIIKERGSR